MTIEIRFDFYTLSSNNGSQMDNGTGFGVTDEERPKLKWRTVHEALCPEYAKLDQLGGVRQNFNFSAELMKPFDEV
jgi:hypothetical protein